MKSFKEFFYSKPNLQQINSYLKGLNKQLSLKDLINHLKKHFELTKIKLNPAGNKVLAFEETKRDYKAEYKKFQSSPEKILTENTREQYYEKQSQEVSDTNSSHVVGWLDGNENQIKRFQTLLDIGVKDGDSVLDVGCGVGHLVEHLKNINLKVCYTGIDTNKYAIGRAKNAYLKESFIYGTIHDLNETYDWGLASGVFNYKFPKLEMLETVDRLLTKVNKGVAFNLLNGFYISPEYVFYVPEEVISYFSKYSTQVSIIENYGIENDFTIYIKKNQKNVNI